RVENKLANLFATVIALAEKADKNDVSAAFNAMHINVMDHGATGDGVTDDRPAFQTAMTFLADGGTLYCPASVYMINGELKLSSNIRIRGAGIDVRTIKSANGLPSRWNTVTNARNDREYRTDCNENIIIEDVTIDGNYSNR